MPEQDEITLAEAARHAGVSAATLKRWGADGIIPDYRGRWTRAAAAHARIVARLREQGQSLDDIKRAGEDGRLAFGYVEELFPARDRRYDLQQAARETGLEGALIERLWRSMGFPTWMLDHLGDEDLEALRYMAAVLEAGFPLVAFLQVLHVYGQALRQVADAEARLFRIYVHEPLIKDGVPSTQMSEEMGELISELLPQTTPLMVYLHRSFLRHSVEQDVIANMWSDLDSEGEELGQLRVAIVFADLVGFVRFTEEEGEQEALDLVESFVTSVEQSLPGSARVVKNIGDGVMIVGTDPVTLTDWAIGFQEGFERRSRPRIGIHFGRTVYRDGDYFGGNVNLASRVVARAHAGEVLVTDTVAEAAADRTDLEFEPIGEVQLKGFLAPTELYLARAP
ncbi:MAG TPA: adenylate/guanylate cyclase domain-containing protein [Solirubrobacterales bacterium]|nr:adenylate/guanylate cyclase domain-containing protein [Solirubrobacterales bacterium]